MSARGEALKKMLRDRARFGADSPVPLCRAIVEHLGMTWDDLECVSIMGATVYKRPPEKVYAMAATLLEAAGVEP